MVDYHVHTQHSIDAAGTISQYCDQAVKIGLEEICFTNHCELDPERDDSYIKFNGEREPFSRAGLLKLQSEIFDARDRYKTKGLIVKFGIEVGYYKGIKQALREITQGIDLDFMIGAVHCLEHICIDSSRECKSYFNDHSAQKYIEQYYDLVASLIQCGMFDSLAHIDVYKKYGRDHYGPELTRIPQQIVNEIFAMQKDNHIALELNTAGMRFMKEFYPAPALMKIARAQGVDMITIGSDSHNPADLGKDLEVATQQLKSLGFDTVQVFSRREPRPYRI